MSPAQLRRAAREVVVRELGVTGLIRLWRDVAPGSGDYTLDRGNWLPEFDSVEAMMQVIAKEGAPGPGAPPR
jgi:hypothetical protein